MAEKVFPKWKIGADPEFWLTEGDGPISAHGYFPGTKSSPHWLGNGAVQVDGTAVEFNITPASSLKDFKHHIKHVMKQIHDMKPKGGSWSFSFTPAVFYNTEYFEALPEEVKLLGCDTDYNAYTEEANPPPMMHGAEYHGMVPRTAGGHVHVGWCENVNPFDETHFDQCLRAIRQLDCILLPGSMLFDQNYSWSANFRRNLYGQPGSFRPKTYGVEYRSLSSTWLKYEEGIDWVYEATIAGMNLLFNGKPVEKDFKKLMLFKVMNKESFYYMNRMYEDYGIPTLPEKLTEIDYGR